MKLAFALFLLGLILWWLLSRELPAMFAGVVSASAIRRRWLNIVGRVMVIGALFLPISGHFAQGLAETYSAISYDSVILVVLVAFVVALLLDRFGLQPSLLVALVAAMEGSRVLTTQGTEFNFSLLIGWCVAPLVAVVVAVLLFGLYKITLGRANVHIIRQAGYLHYVVIVGVALSSFALAVNSGAALVGFASLLVVDELYATLLTIATILILLILLNGLIRRRVDAEAERYLEFSTQVVCVVSYATSITLLLFSTNLVEIIGLCSVPIGLASPIVGAMVGVSLMQRRLVCEGGKIVRTLLGVVLTPLLSTACYYMLASVFSVEAMKHDEWNTTLLVTLLLLASVVAFVGYARRQESLKQATKKLLLSQQQQLFENQKALNDLELKAILAENQSLHGTLELKRKEIVNVALGISEQKEFLEMLSEKVRVAAKSSSAEEKDRVIAELQNDLSQRINSSSEIDEFYAQAEQLHKDFSVKLTEEFPHLTTSERRLATLLRLGFSSKYIATLMNISPKSVEISRYRLRQKLGLQKGDNLINFIKSI